ncbi:pilus assembly protein PilE [Stutzerimonas kirkiae]|uniref:Pilus assembly protein PilE n=1 Tax=Stutzerimonas kirkiae TaxID=2211392 RepID=A0A4Q9R9J7_9GAMM|nr:type IV pilin protein [Stutzerimonas kirkiae]TBU97366.1 pilus assembly protein PilE [Stutzerimonas kirkiae]TBV00341.1 pilus assembly protein PilE [Stutzerimonas kirkiae]
MKAYARALQGGFSLMELTIVAAIIGTLAAIAYPDYREYRLRGLRSEGQALLLELATRQEAYFAQYNRYAISASDFDQLGLSVSAHGHYGAAVAAGDGGYSLAALARFRDDDCANLSLDALGNRGNSGRAGPERCWR